MSETFSEIVFYRGVERWMIVLGGLVFGYLGYRLFLYGVDQGHGKLQTESQFFKLTFSGSGPGLFFMAFGALVLMTISYSSTEYNRATSPATSGQVLASSSGGAQVTSDETEFAAGVEGEGKASSDSAAPASSARGAEGARTGTVSSASAEQESRTSRPTLAQAAAPGGAQVTSESMKFAGGGGAGICDKIRLDAYEENVNDTLWTYQNLKVVQESPAGAHIKALAGILETKVDDEDTRKAMLKEIEEVVCKLE